MDNILKISTNAFLNTRTILELFQDDSNSTDNAVSVMHCSMSNWKDPLCPLGVVMLVLTLITLVLVLISTVRVYIITRRIISYILGIHYCVLLQLILLVIYFAAVDDLWLRFSYELLKIATFIIIGFFFTLSARRFRVLPTLCRKRLIFSIFGLFYIFLIVMFGLTIYWGYSGAGCKNIGRLVFAISQFCFSLVFGIISYLILQYTTSLKVGDMTMSSSFMMKHTRPLTIVLFVYIWTATLNLGLQIFLYVETTTSLSCHEVLLNEDAWVRWSYPIFKQIDLLVPIWAILWYFKETLNRKERKSVSLTPNFIEDYDSDYDTARSSFRVQFAPVSSDWDSKPYDYV